MNVYRNVVQCLARLAAAVLVSAAPLLAAAQVVTYFHNDAAGTPLVATDAAGAVVWKESYQPYGGKLNNQPAASGNRIGFAGKPYDNLTGLAYAGARYYDPVLGRFMGVDPAAVDPAGVHGINRYAYANNNPYKYVDPDGRSPVDVVFLAYDIGKLGLAIYSGTGVGAAAVDVALSVVGVASPVPGAGQALKAVKAAHAVEQGVMAARGAEAVGRAGKAAVAAKGTTALGKFAGESIPARSAARDFTAAERAEVNAIGSKTGCQTCGTTNPGTKSGNFVPDHQPPSALNAKGEPQRLYPQCINCSREQGLEIARQLRQGGQ